MRYLKTHIEGCHPGCDADIYTALDPQTEYTEGQLLELGQEAVNERHPWGIETIDEADVPEGDR